MPAIAKIEFLPDADGRLLVFVYHDPPDAGLDTARLIRPGESFMGVPFEQLVAASTGYIVPDGEGGWRIEAQVRKTARAISGAARSPQPGSAPAAARV
jgi:hypothetical protein